MSSIIIPRYIRQRFCVFLLAIAIILPSFADTTVLSTSPLPQQSPPSVLPPPHNGFADVVAPLMPAVVNIYTVKYRKLDKSKKSTLPEGFPFEQFNELFEQFNIPFNFDEMYSDPKAVSLGSGFIIDPVGYIVTNYHVVSNSDEISVKLLDNRELTAKLIGSDKKTDLALLKVDSKNPLPFVKFGNSAKARVGDWVIAIGNPFGLGGTVTAGIISSKGRDIGLNEGIIDNFIQTDAAINSGNSGGPMFNGIGEVIGVNTAIATPNGVNVGIGFAIPSNTAQNIIAQLKETGKVSRGRLDILIQEVTPEIAEGLGLKEPVGALVVEVSPKGTGDRAGLKPGDVVTEFDGQIIKNSRKLQIAVAETPLNKEVKIMIIRGGKTHALTAIITETPEEGEKGSKDNKNDGDKSNSDSIEKNNITFNNLTSELRQKYAIAQNVEGVIITDAGKQHYGVKVGDVVVAINQQHINSINELKSIYESAKTAKKKNIVLLIKRRNSNVFVALPVL